MIYYIYKICCNNINITDFYIGSTTCFRKRKSYHKSICNNSNSNKLIIYQTIRDNGGWDNWRMVIIEEMIDTTKIQANIREEYYRIELGATLNSMCCGTGLTREEYIKDYYETNKEQKKEQMKEYYKTNKEQIKNQMKEHYKTNKDKKKEYNKEYYKKQKELNKFV